jgi:methylase of polypeptide subunit release factors
MAGDSDASDLVYDAALERLETCKLDMERDQLRNEALKHELAELEANAPPMSELQARKATFEGDKHKFMQLIANLESHQSKQEQKLEQALEEKTQREAEQERLDSELRALKVSTDMGVHMPRWFMKLLFLRAPWITRRCLQPM